MSAIVRHGDGDEGKIIDDVTVDGTTPIASVFGMQETNGVSLNLFSDVNAGVLDADYEPEALSGDVDGSWAVFCSNDWVAEGGGAYGAVPTDGRWTDITSQFVPAIQPVDHTDMDTVAQYVQCSPLDARAILVVFYPSAGDGDVAAHAYAKSQG